MWNRPQYKEAEPENSWICMFDAWKRKKSQQKHHKQIQALGQKKIRIDSSPSETTRPWNICFPHKKKHPLPKGSAVLNKLNLKNLPRKKQTKPSWPKKGHNKSTNLDLPSMKLTCSPLKMDGLWDDPFLLGGNAFFFRCFCFFCSFQGG